MTKQTELQLKMIFSKNFFSDNFDPEGKEFDISQDILAKNKWSEIYNWFYTYLTGECLTAESVYNSINLYFCYLFDSHTVPNPYELCGYILYRIDIDEYWDIYGNFVDGFIIKILETAKKINIVTNPYYKCWDDPKIIEEKDKWAKKYLEVH